MCNVTGHIHSNSASTTFSRAATLLPASLVSPDAPSSHVPAPPLVNETLTSVRPPQHYIFVPESLNPPHQMAAEDLHIPPASHDPVTASVRVLQGDVDTSTTITPLPTPEPSVTALPPGSKTLVPLPGVIAVQHVEDRGTSPDVLGVPSLPSPTPVLGNVFLTGSHTPLLAPAIPSTSRPWLASAPDLIPAAERESKNIIAARDLPPQSPSPSSVADVATVGPSRGSGYTGDCPPHVSHGQYNIV
ncbi:hypothetical protein H4582DRAFT_1977746 [Lactarius indigo]|nr:hypothetical protein H4582DRAFT_1977746 [Lactarius indigo]